MPELPDDSDVRLITAEFYANAQMLDREVERDVESITFVDTYGKCSWTVGQCEWFVYEDGSVARKRITLLRGAWENGTPQFKRTLLFHELGHCALGLNHVAPGSEAIMNPNVLDDEVSSSKWFDLVRELFQSTQEIALQGSEEGDEDECGK